MYRIGFRCKITTHFCGSTTACFGIAFCRTIRLLVYVYFTPPATRKSEGGPPRCSMPLGVRSGVLLSGVVLTAP